MEIKIECPWCNQNYSIDGSLIGQKVECSICEKEFVVRNPSTPASTLMNKKTFWTKSNIRKGFILFGALGIILRSLCVIYYIKDISDKEYKNGLAAFEAQRYEEASGYFQKATRLGHKKAKEEYKKSQAEVYYSRGENAYLLHHFEEAVDFFQKAAEMGLPKGQLSLGLCYYNGNGIKKDNSEAVKWIRRAAEQDYLEAQYKVGLCYLLGAGVSRQEKEAEYWLQKAAEQGHGDAMSALAGYYRSIDDFDKAEYWLYKALNPKPIAPASSK